MAKFLRVLYQITDCLQKSNSMTVKNFYYCKSTRTAIKEELRLRDSLNNYPLMAHGMSRHIAKHPVISQYADRNRQRYSISEEWEGSRRTGRCLDLDFEFSCVNFPIVYVTGPQESKEPLIRVLYISFSYNSILKRARFDDKFPAFDESIQIIQPSGDNGFITIDKDEWDLEAESRVGEFFQNNIVLECYSSFPVFWKYSGYGNPVVTEENVRIHGNINDTSTFSYLSILNLMPITEKSTGNYSCSGGSNETRHITTTSVHLFVPGSSTFLIDYDTMIESPGEEKIFVPCPVTNSSASISLYFKNELVSSGNSLFIFDPRTGFYLTPKFVEEQSEPWGQFFCKNDETGEKSGMITIQPTKDLIVNAVPETNTVLLSKESFTENPNEIFKFVCQAKEEVTLKFLKVVRNPMVQYDYNSSSTFPFSAYTEVNTKNFRNSSRIYCRTVRNNEDLHSWKVLISSLALHSESMDFHYDTSKEDFACCSPSNKKARLTLLPCNSLSECRIKGHCLLPGHLCNPDTITVLPERAGCVRYKLLQGESTSSEKDFSRRGFNDNSGSSDSSSGENKENAIVLESGLLQCSIERNDQQKIFFAVRSKGENGTLINTVSAHDVPSSGLEFAGIFKPPIKAAGSLTQDLQIMEITEKKVFSGRRRRFLCKGAKFFVSMGFIWETVSSENELNFYPGRDIIKGPWVNSQFDVFTTPVTSRRSRIKRIYCIAPLWNSESGGWVHVKIDIDL